MSSPHLHPAIDHFGDEDSRERQQFVEAFVNSSSGSQSNEDLSPQDALVGLPALASGKGNDRTYFDRPPGNHVGGMLPQLDKHHSTDLDRIDLIDGLESRPKTTTGHRSQPGFAARSRMGRREIGCFCGPGRKRYLIALLCCACLTVIIGMRAEMLGIIAHLHSNSSKNVIDNHVNNDFNNKLNSHPSTKTIHFKPSEHRQMPWTTAIQDDLVENAIFFAYLISSPIGGFLTVNHDSSFLLGCSVALTCGMNLFLPLIATVNAEVGTRVILIILLRLVQGMAEGCLIPAVFGVLRFWSPIAERSTLVCLAVIGVSLGPLIGLPVCSEIEKNLGWGVVFYIYANLGLLWCVFWWRLIDEQPAKDERLGSHERAYLLNTALESHTCYSSRVPIRIPWKAIFSSRPVIAIFFTYAADDWTFQISSVCMQTFYQQMYNVDVNETIIHLSFPFLSRSLLVPVGGLLADFLRAKSGLSTTTITKLFAGLGFGLKGVFFVALGFAPTKLYATVLLSLSLGFSGLAVAGYAVNVIDLAPNFAGLMMGFANSISALTGILSTVTASLVVHKLGLAVTEGWLIALGLAALSQCCAMLIYLTLGSSESQEWAHGGCPAPKRPTPSEDTQI